jgi:hypothetical protein
MSYFTKEDFKENWERLTVIVNQKLGISILSPFKSLTDSKKKRFNKILNEYIREIGGHENWKERLLNDFHDIVQEELFDNPNFKVENQFVKEGGHEVLLTEEQRDFLEKKRIELGEKEIIY